MTRTHVFALVLASLAAGAFAKANPAPKYRVTEVAAPSEADTCLPGYAINISVVGVIDRCVSPGNLLCYVNSEFANGVVLPTMSVSQAFVWNRVAGAME